jgi:L-rhamnose isomerase / sugar isomerase
LRRAFAGTASARQSRYAADNTENKSMTPPISVELIAEENARQADHLAEDYGTLGRKLARTGINIEVKKVRVAGFSVAVSSWGAGRGGTRFAKFPIASEPTNIHEKLEDCAVIQQLSQVTPRVSPHFPWDKVSDYAALREEAASLNLGFDAVNSNTFQDQPGQAAPLMCSPPIAPATIARARRRSANP